MTEPTYINIAGEKNTFRPNVQFFREQSCHGRFTLTLRCAGAMVQNGVSAAFVLNALTWTCSFGVKRAVVKTSHLICHFVANVINFLNLGLMAFMTHMFPTIIVHDVQNAALGPCFRESEAGRASVKKSMKPPWWKLNGRTMSRPDAVTRNCIIKKPF